MNVSVFRVLSGNLKIDTHVITKEENARDLKSDINAESKFKQNKGQRKLTNQLGWLPHVLQATLF